MKVTLIPGPKVDDEIVRIWVCLQQANPDLASPYFHPEFTRIIASVRNDVEVAVIEDGGRIAALFPFQRERKTVGGAVGRPLSDYHGLICAPDYECDPCELMKQCGLVAWDFDHLVASQRCFAPFHQSVDISPQIVLSNGFEVYSREQKAVKSEQIKIRRLTRDYGPLRFVPHTASKIDMQQLLAWKSQQYKNTGKRDIFIQPWTTSIVQDVHATQDRHFSGMLSLLYAGDRLAAAHFGIRSDGILHSWFPAYAPELATYSPGLILLLKIAEHAPSVGIKTIDLGQGMFEWKQRFMNASVPLAAGSVELPSLRYARHALRRSARSLAVRLNLHGPARKFLYALRREQKI